jgi:hypothetical protein
MGIFYNPPQPPTASNAGTPPEPHAPIGTQGSQPPRYSTVLMLTAVLASWPADLEPRLHQKNTQQNKIAPLTLTYGAQPTPQPPLSTVELAQIVGTWQQTWDAQTAPKSAAWNIPPIVSTLVPRTPPPALIWTAWVEPFVRPPTPVAIAPLTLVYGDAPPIRGTSPLQAQLAAWADPWIVQAGPKNAAWNVPPIVAAIIPANAFPYQILRAWQDDPNRPPRLVTIAPLTLTYGSQPPVQAPLSAATRIALQAWPLDLEPRLGRPNDQRVRIAPLTLVYGNTPAPHGPLSPTLLSIVARSWQPADPFPPPLETFGQGTPPPTVFGGADLAIRDQVITAIAVGDVAIQLVGYVQQVITDGAVAYWRLGETSGTTAVDSVGGKNGTISGGVTLGQTGALADGNKAMLFDGATGKIVTVANVTIPVVCTLEAWIKVTLDCGFFSSRTVGATGQTVYFGTSSGKIFLFSTTTSGGATPLIDGRWHHVVVVLDGITATFYVDGLLDGTPSAQARTTPSVGVVSIGWDQPTNSFWPNLIDEVAIYPTALTALQVAAHYAAASPLVDLIVSDTEVTALTVTDTLLITS